MLPMMFLRVVLEFFTFCSDVFFGTTLNTHSVGWQAYNTRVLLATELLIYVLHKTRKTESTTLLLLLTAAE